MFPNNIRLQRWPFGSSSSSEQAGCLFYIEIEKRPSLALVNRIKTGKKSLCFIGLHLFYPYRFLFLFVNYHLVGIFAFNSYQFFSFFFSFLNNKLLFASVSKHSLSLILQYRPLWYLLFSIARQYSESIHDSMTKFAILYVRLGLRTCQLARHKNRVFPLQK